MITLLLLAALSVTTALGFNHVKDHSLSVMEDTSDSIYSLHHSQGRGTGWATLTKSGRKVIVTNVHVCESEDPVMYTQKNGKKYLLPVIAKDPSHDICLLEAPRKAVPLVLADKVVREETAYSVGFPAIDFMTSQKGYIKGYQEIRMQYPLPPEKCKGQKKLKLEKIEVEQEDGKMKTEEICVFSAEGLVTTIQVDGGASGSPILNSDEEVIGMTMARVGNINWAQGVPLKNLRAFLNKY